MTYLNIDINQLTIHHVYIDDASDALHLKSAFKRLKGREKERPLTAMNVASIDFNLLFAPLYDSIRFKHIGIIKKGDILLRTRKF